MNSRLTPLLLIALPTLFAACSNPEKTAQYPLTPSAVVQDLPNRLGRTELREVSLPQYAAGQEVVFQTADGALRSTPDNIWADAPTRAVTQLLASQISGRSGATVIAEPWPLAEGPDRRLEVRVSEILPGADGQLRLAGQYFVAPTDYTGRDIVRGFDIRVPLAGEGPAAIAAAQTEAVSQLAARIARLD